MPSEAKAILSPSQPLSVPQALLVAVCGLLVVFMMLAILMVVIMVISKVVASIESKRSAGKAAAPKAAEAPAAPGAILLEKKNIVLNCKSVTPEEAIRACGRLMVESGYCTEGYVQGMIERNAGFPVAIGSHVAIPHGTNESREFIKKTGLVVMTYPDGIQWDEETVRLVIGIASQGEEHLDILNRIVEVAETEEDTDALVDSATVEDLYKKLNGLN